MYLRAYFSRLYTTEDWTLTTEERKSGSKTERRRRNFLQDGLRIFSWYSSGKRFVFVADFSKLIRFVTSLNANKNNALDLISNFSCLL